ncbi:unnamed protein product [Auanema sp. JU1783]|nr:unnamed protein product [Auanema sp. JU1783]
MIVKQILGGTTSALGQISKNCGIEDIAARLQKQQNGVSNGSSENMNTVLADEPSDPGSIYNNTPLMTLICDDCGLEKNSSEEMEVHIKTEHLRWLPFQCPICLCERASDAQMREHVHVMHRKVMHKFIYADNITAKRELQKLMDRSLSNAITRKKAESAKDKNNSNSNGSLMQLDNMRNSFIIDENFKNPKFDLSESPPAEPMPGTVSEGRKRPHVEITEGSSSTDALLACISRAATAAGAFIDGEVMDEENPLTSLFSSKKLKADIDQLIENSAHNETELEGYGDENVLEALNPLSVLDDVAALFGQTDGRIEEAAVEKRSNNAKSSQVSKKRVLGECSKCNKPVTAGARQMHMFFHLAKDHGTYRFRCKFEGCQVEHYRKDQMENHQSKVHGKIDPDMMEDRSLELFQRCQELSMELLGTKNGSTPGPTAVKAEATYQAQQAANKTRGQNSAAAKSPATMSNSLITGRGITDDEHPLECRLCGKTMQNRIRGFHILWHMAKDMGINRYICKFCGFGHDRSQSVQTHGKKEHGTEDVVQDRINEYEEEVKQMSQKCFGFQALFSQDNKRRSKIPVTMPSSKMKKEDGEGTNSEQDETNASRFQEEEPNTMDETETEPFLETENKPDLTPLTETVSDLKDGSSFDLKSSLEAPTKEEATDEDSSPSRTPARKKRSNGKFPRFGLRRPASKVKKLEMAKLREISLLLGGAHYYKKKTTEMASCELCGKLTNSRLGEHAYTHMDQHLYLCPKCDFGGTGRDNVSKHIREVHDSNDRPVDNRLKYAEDIKGTIKKCYPTLFVDMPTPTAQDIGKLRQQMGSTGARIVGVSTDNEENEDEQDQDHEHDDEELDEEEASFPLTIGYISPEQ